MLRPDTITKHRGFLAKPVVLFLGRQLGTFQKADLSELRLMRLMAGKTDALADISGEGEHP